MHLLLSDPTYVLGLQGCDRPAAGQLSKKKNKVTHEKLLQPERDQNFWSIYFYTPHKGLHIAKKNYPTCNVWLFHW